MTSSKMTQTELSPIVACTISRDVQNFDLLIEDMEAALGENWGDLGFDRGAGVLQPARSRFTGIRRDRDRRRRGRSRDAGRDHLARQCARDQGDPHRRGCQPVGPAPVAASGRDEFVPYPLPEGELQAAIDRLRKRDERPHRLPPGRSPFKLRNGRGWRALAVQPLLAGPGPQPWRSIWHGNWPR